MELIIQLKIAATDTPRYAQNRSETWDASITVIHREYAKRFTSYAQAYRWLRRHNFPVHAPTFNMPPGYTGWEIIEL